MRKKGFLTLGLVATMCLSCSFFTYAAEWKRNDIGWWWETRFGTYPTNSWCWIDGNHDGIMENYYFDENGYLLVNTTTPDNYTVNENGAKVVDGKVYQTESHGIYFYSDGWVDNGPETEVGFDDFCNEYYANFSKNFSSSIEDCEDAIPREELRRRLDYEKATSGLMEEDARRLLILESEQRYPLGSSKGVTWN